MSHRIQESADAVVLAPAAQATASVIWLHGLGADGHDFVPIVPELELPPAPGLRFVFPHAPAARDDQQWACACAPGTTS